MSTSKTTLKKLIFAIKKSKHKYVTLERLSKSTGLYPDVLSDMLVEFEPMIKFDASIDCRDLLPQMETSLEKMEVDNPKEKRVRISKKEILSYRSIGDFVYQKFASIDGMMMPSVSLNDEDLHVLKKLVDNEVSLRKKNEKKKRNQ